MLGGGIFPDGIVSEILIRLPVKAVTRFKCVSKRWKAIACNPNFIISYILRSSPTWVILDRYIRVDSESEPDFKVQWEQPPNVSTLSINPTDLGDGSKEFLIKGHKFPAPLINSSNGLILFTIIIKRDPFKEKTATSFSWISEEDSFYVVNPITREWVPIPKPPKFVQIRASAGFITEVGPIGVLKRFMIVEYQPIIGSDAATLMCFSSETGKWELISANYMLGVHMWCGHDALEFDGHLMWVDFRVGIITWDDPFGWGKEKEKDKVHCRFIKLPRPSPDSEEDRRCVNVSGGHIQFMEVRKGGGYELCLWRLQDYQGGEWSLVHKLRFKDVWPDDSYLGYGLKKVLPQPCFMHPYEADVVVLRVGDRAFSLNLGTRKVECCGTGYSSLYKYTYLAPFMLPSWPLSFSRSLKATILKEEGNVYFKAKNFSEAINCYSKSITASPNALAYANRAVAYLQVASYHEAEVDCTEALKLDGEYFKAYGRRAIARKELGDLKGCVEDVEFALKLEPDNQGMKKLYAEAKSLIDMVQVQASSSGLDPMPTALPVQNDAFVKQDDDLGHARG